MLLDALIVPTREGPKVGLQNHLFSETPRHEIERDRTYLLVRAIGLEHRFRASSHLGYLYARETVSAAREGIGRNINFYNARRPHSGHQARTPDVVYFASLHYPSAEVV